MNLQVIVHTDPGAEGLSTTVREGTTLQELLSRYEKKEECPVLAAMVNNRYVELTYSIERDCEVTFLSLQDPSMDTLYQRSVTFLYLKAVNDIFGDSVPVEIYHATKDGLYTVIEKEQAITDDDVVKIKNRMDELVKQNVLFERNLIRGDRVEEIFDEKQNPEKVKLLRRAGAHWIPFYSCEGFTNFFYGAMVPSAGYLYAYDLQKYEDGVILRFPTSNHPQGVKQPFQEEKKLYRAFRESSEWCRLLNIAYVSDLNEMIEKGDHHSVILISEALHEKRIAEIADEINTKKKRIIFVAGPSSSGKTTFAQRLCVQLRVNGCHPHYLGLDDYYLDRERCPKDENGNYRFEDLDSLDLNLFSSQMNALLQGEPVDVPRFDFKEGKKIFGTRITQMKKGDLILIEGIHGLNPQLHKGISEEEIFKVYIGPFTQLSIDNHNRISTTYSRLLRRIVRDHQFRDWSAADTIRHWPEVRAGELRNIFPYSDKADVLFNSVHIYELAVLKKYALPLLKEVREDEDGYREAEYIMKFLRFVKTIEDDSMIANNSILREFIGGSIFV